MDILRKEIERKKRQMQEQNVLVSLLYYFTSKYMYRSEVQVYIVNLYIAGKLVPL